MLNDKELKYLDEWCSRFLWEDCTEEAIWVKAEVQRRRLAGDARSVNVIVWSMNGIRTGPIK